ncbi:MAG TPA: hypothetical protein VFA69_00570 [Candidatus Nitrosotalea sp.]|nr:hypothetical protein [Candidatus Nitrosotalea sp.]
MINNSQNANHYKAANQVIQKLEFLSHVDSDIADAHNHGNKQAEITLHILKAVEQRYTDFMKRFLISEASVI